MKMFVITDDENTKTGLGLAGIDGVLATDEKIASDALDRAFADREICAVLITRGIREICHEKCLELEKTPIPVLCEIPCSSEVKNADFSKNI